MKKYYFLFLAFVLWNISLGQVTQMYTDYNNFWTSSSTSVNPIQPNLSHNLLAFRWNGTVYSTGVNNAKLTSNGVTFANTKFRALPITTVPLLTTSVGSSTYLAGEGSLTDGSTATATHTPIDTGTLAAAFLTDGRQGLNIGTCLANLPAGTPLTFNLSAAGITLANIGDGQPDILISQTAIPTGTQDKIYFTDNNNVLVGQQLTINMLDNSHPIVGKWKVDFFMRSGATAGSGYINIEKDYRFFAADMSAFGIQTTDPSASNYYTKARKLVYVPGGTSDPAFLGFNEPSIGVASQLQIASQPVATNCNGSMPSNFSIQVTDSFGYAVEQAGYVVTASMYSGPGQLLGTLTATTDALGVATFSNLSFEVGADHKVEFSSTSLATAISATVAGPDCTANVWTGNVSSVWNNTGNWQTASIPNANNNVTIPAGRQNYPVLTANAGAKNLTMGAGATINLNGRLFTIKGTITKDATASITAATAGSELYMSGTAAQTIPSGFITGNTANFTVDNPAGVTTDAAINITEVVKVISGNFETHGNLSLLCSFSPRKTGLIGRLNGTISGNVTTEQCFPARRAYRFVSPSVTTTTSIRANWQEGATAWNSNPNPGYGTHITGAGAAGTNPTATDGINGFDWQPSGSPSMYLFNNSTQNWGAATSTTGVLTAGAPYRLLIRGSRSTDITSNSSLPTNTKLRSAGTIKQGNVAVTGLSSANNAWNFVGNPYHSVVDMGAVLGSAVNLSPFYYIWDPTIGGSNPIPGQPGGRGAFVTINALNGASSNPTSVANRYLQPYQAFFIQTGTQGTTPQLTFTEASKVTSMQTNVFRMGIQPYVDMALYYEEALATEETATDGVNIAFGTDDNNEVDMLDAPKFSNLDENLSRKAGDQLISMENRSMPQDGEELPLSLTQYRKQNYVFRIKLGYFEGMNVYLKDAYLNQQTLLEGQAATDVTFNVDASIPASTAGNRFSLLFEAEQLGTGGSTKNPFSVFPNPVTGNDLFINTNGTFDNAEIAIFNTLGQKVYETKGNFAGNNQMAVKVNTLQAGIYVLKLKTIQGAFYSTKFIKE